MPNVIFLLLCRDEFWLRAPQGSDCVFLSVRLSQETKKNTVSLFVHSYLLSSLDNPIRYGSPLPLRLLLSKEWTINAAQSLSIKQANWLGLPNTLGPGLVPCHRPSWWNRGSTSNEANGECLKTLPTSLFHFENRPPSSCFELGFWPGITELRDVAWKYILQTEYKAVPWLLVAYEVP